MDLDVRMKAYEDAFRFRLPIRMPVVIRLDGKAFHTLTQKCERPFDAKLRGCLIGAATALLSEVPARMGYHQSDELSLLFVDYNKFDSQQWFDGVIQKMASVSASILGVQFTKGWGHAGYFDARVFPVPERDIENYFIWRQQDCMRNAVSMAAQAQFSHKELLGKHTDEMIGMLKERGIFFDQYPEWARFGSVVTRDGTVDTPIFSKHPEFLKQFLTVEDQ